MHYRLFRPVLILFKHLSYFLSVIIRFNDWLNTQTFKKDIKIVVHVLLGRINEPKTSWLLKGEVSYVARFSEQSSLNKVLPSVHNKMLDLLKNFLLQLLLVVTLDRFYRVRNCGFGAVEVWETADRGVCVCMLWKQRQTGIVLRESGFSACSNTKPTLFAISPSSYLDHILTKH